MNMDRDSTQEFKTLHPPSSGRKESNSSTEYSNVSVTRSRKRKATGDCGIPPKRRRVSESVSESVSGSKKRKSSAEKEDTKKRQRTAEPEPRLRGTKRKITDDKDETRKRQKMSEHDQKNDDATSETSMEDFEAKYHQLEQLGEGGQGSVYAGFRRADNFPVAIKRIPREKIKYEDLTENSKALPLEVAIMLKMAGAESVGKSAAISLLDHYHLDQELILVLERPVPCVDLLQYMDQKGGTLQEEEARLIMKQLVEAARELESKNIFHRDIKLENILIETGTDVPRLRLIDFGLSCFTKETSSYSVFCGTVEHIPPEWLQCFTYSAGPTTVWQLGVVLYEMLHTGVIFDTVKFLCDEVNFSEKLSWTCRDVLCRCLDMDPQQRPSLEQLQLHHWLA